MKPDQHSCIPIIDSEFNDTSDDEMRLAKSICFRIKPLWTFPQRAIELNGNMIDVTSGIVSIDTGYDLTCN